MRMSKEFFFGFELKIFREEALERLAKDGVRKLKKGQTGDDEEKKGLMKDDEENRQGKTGPGGLTSGQVLSNVAKFATIKDSEFKGFGHRQSEREPAISEKDVESSSDNQAGHPQIEEYFFIFKRNQQYPAYIHSLE